MRANIDAVENDILRGEQGSETLVDGLEPRPVKIATPDAGLVCNHDQSETKPREPAQARCSSRQQFDLFRVSEVILLDNNGAVAIQ
ncbi:hypothetical protein AYO49_01080 [Verrucomicrobiaceae bacterium SCGC AG-212-N21]|nr:hypothetical protein AYO49_01080 [Verrucomicrobiaceae bacterium SCGC AG-212-N21]